MVLGVSRLRRRSRRSARPTARKPKRYHPDAGGEDWTFRILSQAYEMLSTARVGPGHAAPRGGPRRAAARGDKAHAQADSRRRTRAQDGIGSRRDIRPRTPHGRASSAVELLCIRYLWDDADYLWLTQRVPDEDRFLSCNLTIELARHRDAASRISSHDEQAQILATLQEIFDHMIITTRVVTSRSRVAGRPVRRLALVLQFRPGFQGGRHAARSLEIARPGHAAVVARPIHSAVPPLIAAPLSPGSARRALRARTS